MYLRVREIFAMAADYSPTLSATTQFFRFIQNKLLFAARRRALLEAEGAESNVRALEDAAKALRRPADKKTE